MTDHSLCLKTAFGQYMGRFYAGLCPDTPAMEAYVDRGLTKSIVLAPGRMIDSVEEMLKAYQKNENNRPGEAYRPGANALFPIMIVAVAKDYIPTGGDFGGKQVGRRLVALEDGAGASVYGYRQAMGDVRAQVAVMSAEDATARSLAVQFSLFIGEVKNRRFPVTFPWHSYELEMTCMLETPDIIFSKVDPENQSMTILVADITLKAVFPYLDAPRAGEDNDGSTNVPPGYPLVEQINCLNQVTGDVRVVRVDP